MLSSAFEPAPGRPRGPRCARGVAATALVAALSLSPQPPRAAALGAADEDLASPSTREMAALLKERAALVDPEALSLVVNDRRADLLASLLARPLPLGERLQLRGRAVVELANAGRPREALKALAVLEQDARENDPASWQRYRAGARLVEAMAYMRLAEDENCHLQLESGLLPAADPGRWCPPAARGRGGRHPRARRGVEPGPVDLRARWLLNIAHMTLGTYPAGVPERCLVPPDRLRVGVSAAALPERRGGGRARRLRPRRRRRSSRTSTTTAGSTS